MKSVPPGPDFTAAGATLPPPRAGRANFSASLDASGQPIAPLKWGTLWAGPRNPRRPPRAHMKTLLRITKKKAPLGEPAGYRIQAAHENMAARKMYLTKEGFRATKVETPSFRPPYLIHESMDYAQHSDITPAEVARFMAVLAWKGIKEEECVVLSQK